MHAQKRELSVKMVKVLAGVGSGIHVFRDCSCRVTTLCALAKILVESEWYRKRDMKGKNEMGEKMNALPV